MRSVGGLGRSRNERQLGALLTHDFRCSRRLQVELFQLLWKISKIEAEDDVVRQSEPGATLSSGE